MNDSNLDSTLRCPLCRHEEHLKMPIDSCLYFHECTSCRALLRPKDGDCCVFCSYGTKPCPSKQRQN